MKKNVTQATENTEVTSSVAAKPYKKRFAWLISALSLLVLGATALIILTFVDFSDTKTNKPGANNSAKTGYPYSDTAITDYIPLTKDMVTGHVIPGADVKLKDVTDESVKTSINQQLLAAVAITEEQKAKGQYVVKRTLPIGYADEIRLHVLYVKNEAGERVGEKYFPSAYMASNFFQVGMAYFGKDFDDALIGLVPSETGVYEVRTHGTVDASSVICLTYNVTEKIPATEEGGKETTKTHLTMSSERIELALKDEAWRNLLLENYGTVGQSFSFDYEEDIDDDGTTEKVTYNCVISSVLTREEYVTIKATLPEDFFAEGYADEELVALNGKELTFYISIDFMIDHEANTWETMTLVDMTNTLGFTPENKTDLAAARAECLTALKKQAEESNKTNEPTVKLGLVWNYLLDHLAFTGTLPAEALNEAIKSAKEQVEYYYNYYYSSDALFAETFPNIDLYAASSYMWNYDAADYDGYEDYIENYYAPRTVKQMLLVYGIYNTCINNENALSTEYESLMAEIIAANTTETSSVTRQEVIDYYGETYLREQSILALVNKYLTDNNQIDWNTYKDPK